MDKSIEQLPSLEISVENASSGSNMKHRGIESNIQSSYHSVDKKLGSDHIEYVLKEADRGGMITKSITKFISLNTQDD